MVSLSRHPFFTGNLPAVLVLSVFAFAIGYHYAGQFYYFDTVDDSLITDPAWRMVHGQVPFRDFGLIQGLTAAFFEAVFLAVFGANLQALAIHVAAVNALAAIVAYFILRLVGLSRVTAFVFAALTGVIFYPPQGLAFSVQHGTLMMMTALLLVLLANFQLKTTATVAWFGCGLALAFAFLSKQTLGFYLPGLLVLMFYGSARRILTSLCAVTLGGILPFVVLLVAAGADAQAATRMLTYLVTMPWEFGGGRLDADLNEALVVYELVITPTIVATAAFAFAGAVLFLGGFRKPDDGVSAAPANRCETALAFVAVGALWMIGNVCLARIHHWDANLLLQSVFLSAGIVLAGFVGLIETSGESGTARPAAKARPFVIILCFIALYDGWWAFANVVKHRGVRNIDSVLATRLQISPQTLYPEIKGARFREFDQRQTIDKRITRADIERDIAEKARLISFFRSLPGEFIVYGFPKILRIFAGKVDPLPAIAIQPGASSPYRESKAFPAFIADLERNIVRFNVQGLILQHGIFRASRDYIAAHPKVFCGNEPADVAAVVKFCPRDTLPQGFGYVVGHVLQMDGELY
jgi:hypothetical protein